MNTKLVEHVVVTAQSNNPTGLFKLNGVFHYSTSKKIREDNEGFHVYILSNERIKNGYAYDMFNKEVIYYNGDYGERPQFESIKKITASSDASLGLPVPTHKWMGEFANFPIGKVMVQYEEDITCESIYGATGNFIKYKNISNGYKLTLDSGNTIVMEHVFIEPIQLKAGDERIMVQGRTLPVDFRILSEENYQLLLAGYNKSLELENTCLQTF